MRRLTLAREALTDLTPDELAGVAGGDATPSCPAQSGVECPTMPLLYCLSARICY